MHNIMNNIEKIEKIEKIVCPYFTFNMDDFYGDKGSCEYTKIEEITTLFFKLNGKDRKLSLSKNKEQEMVDKIKNLNKSLNENLDKDKEDQHIDNKDIDLPVPPRLVTSLLLPLSIQVLQGLPWS